MPQFTFKYKNKTKHQERCISRLLGSSSELVYLLTAEEIAHFNSYTREIKLITGTGLILLFNTKVPQNDQIHLNKLEKLNKQTLTLF